MLLSAQMPNEDLKAFGFEYCKGLENGKFKMLCQKVEAQQHGTVSSEPSQVDTSCGQSILQLIQRVSHVLLAVQAMFLATLARG